MERELLHKYFSAQTSTDEENSIMDWVEESDENMAVFLSERKLWNISTLLSEPAAAGETLLSANKEVSIPEEVSAPKEVSTPKNVRPLIWRIASVAAVFLLIIIGFRMTNTARPPAGEFTAMVPHGQQIRLVLADGSNVWLNSNTTFSYETDFNGKTRIVKLNGEAYFDVVNNKKPFIVETGNYRVEVKGTKFNVFAYSSKANVFKTSVSEGSVEVSDNSAVDQPDEKVLLKANEQVFLKDNKLQKDTYNPDSDHSLWTKGILIFNDEPLKNVMDVLGAYYNQEIVVEGTVSEDYRCTAKFSYNDELDYILKIIQRDAKFEIVRDDDNGSIILR